MCKKKMQKLCVNDFSLLRKLKKSLGRLFFNFKIVSFFILMIFVTSSFAQVTNLGYSAPGTIFKTTYNAKSSFKLNSNDWNNVPEIKLSLFPQSTVLLNDKTVNIALKMAVIREVSVKAIYNSTKLYVRLEWEDKTFNVVTEKETASFGDSIAIEIPKDFTERLPYVGMGDERKNVYIYMQRAREPITMLNEYVGAGFGSLTQTPKNISTMQMNYLKSEKKWQALFSLPLQQRNMKQNLLPLAIAVWDGEGLERGGNKYLSAWCFLEMDRFDKNKKFKEQVTFAYTQQVDLEKGKTIFNSVCMSCHKNGDQGQANEGIAPNLKFIGAISTQAYLRDSLLDPNQVVVRHLNINRHYNKAENPDKYRAYPANDIYRWYFVDEKGVRISKMPSFKSMDEKDIQNVVAYLKTL